MREAILNWNSWSTRLGSLRKLIRINPPEPSNTSWTKSPVKSYHPLNNTVVVSKLVVKLDRQDKLQIKITISAEEPSIRQN